MGEVMVLSARLFTFCTLKLAVPIAVTSSLVYDPALLNE